MTPWGTKDEDPIVQKWGTPMGSCRTCGRSDICEEEFETQEALEEYKELGFCQDCQDRGNMI